MKIYSLKKKTIPKLAVLATGLVAALLAVTISPQAAEAHVGYTQDCTGCHGSGASITATGPSATLAPGANYTVQLTAHAGYWITGNGASVAGGSESSVAMVAPAAAGTYTYTVYVRNGNGGSTTYGITVAAVPVTTTPPVTTTTEPPVTTTTEPPVTTTTEPPVTTTTKPPVAGHDGDDGDHADNGHHFGWFGHWFGHHKDNGHHHGWFDSFKSWFR